jgi:hypothetical protein
MTVGNYVGFAEDHDRNGRRPNFYTPNFKIDTTAAAPNDPQRQDTIAADFEAGHVQNLTANNVVAIYNDGSRVEHRVDPLPMLDRVSPGDPGAHPLFISGPNSFTANGSQVSVGLDDIPNWSAAIGILNWVPKPQNPNNALISPNAKLKQVIHQAEFTTWFCARHKPTGQIKRLHYVKWKTDYSLQKSITGGWRVKPGRITMVLDDGQGEGPQPVFGGPLPNDAQHDVYVPPAAKP